ncbi:MAG: hypothetical protein EPO35_03305 [Acidobacteria bacterium]|nr:MAG: hypothetical protein EPO35_03305 [Acidobacteriota bacterium]
MKQKIVTAAGAAVLLMNVFAVPAAAQSSWGMGVTRTGSIVFCDRVRSTVWRIDSSGRRTAALEGVSCRAVATGLDGEVVGESTPVDVTTTRGVGVWRLDANGLTEWLMAPTLVPAPGVWIARDATGRAYNWTGVGSGSAQSAIVAQDPSGLHTDIAGGTRGNRDGFGRDAAFDNVTGLAAAPDGSLLVIDNGNIRRVHRTGLVTTEALGVVTDSHIGLINAPGLWAREIGIAADDRGEAVVVDPAAGRVVHIDRAGRAVSLWAPSGWSQRLTGGRWGWRPAGVALLGRTYYVVDEWVGPAVIADIVGSPRVMQVDDAGNVTRIASVPGWTARIGGVLLLLVLLSLVVRRRRS